MTINSAYQTGNGSTSVAEVDVSAYQDHMFDGVDKTALTEKITAAHSLSSEKDRYSQASMERLNEAIINAEAIVNGDASSALVEDSVAKLQDCMNALIDITALADDLQAAGKLQEQAYSEQSWKVFTQILNEINESYQQITSNKELQDAHMKLQYAMHQLERLNVDKDTLNDLYQKVKDTTDKGYTKDSWENFQNALQHAKELLDDENATQYAVGYCYR